MVEVTAFTKHSSEVGVARYIGDIRVALAGHAAWLLDPNAPVKRFHRRMIFNAGDLRILDGRNRDLRSVIIEYSNLSGVNFTGADARNAIFVACRFLNCDFTGAQFDGADFTDTDLRGATFTTELLACKSLKNVWCDDAQLPWLIGNLTFSRYVSDRNVP